MIRANLKIAPVMMAFALAAGGCATAHTRFSDKIITNPDDCWSMVQRVHEKVKGKKTEVTGTEVISRTYSEACGDRQVEQREADKAEAIRIEQERGAAAVAKAREEGQAAVRKARIESDAAIQREQISLTAQMLSAAVGTETNPSAKAEILKKILARLDSADRDVRESQAAANAESGLSEELIRAQLKTAETSAPAVKCRPAEGKKGTLTFLCS
jgi:hypothetical protein